MGRLNKKQDSSAVGGAFVVLVGPDGVGKTTVATEMIRRRGGCTGYVHFRPPFWSRLEQAPERTDVAFRNKAHSDGSLVMGVARLTYSFFSFWLGYLVRIRPAVRRGCLVVGDRWGYGYVLQPTALGFHGPRWAARLLVSWMPRPDLLVSLEAPVSVVMSRKQELSATQIEEEISLVRSLPSRRFLSVDATREASSVAGTILASVPS